MPEPKFPKLDWTKKPELNLCSSRATRPIVLHLRLTEEPDEHWPKHFKEALSQSSIGMDVDCELEGDTLVVHCSAPLECDLPRYMEDVLQKAGIAWSNERNAEEQWAAARKREFHDLKAEWDRKRSPLTQAP